MKKLFFLLISLGTLFYLCSCQNSNTAKTQSEVGEEPGLKSTFINGDSIHFIDMGKGDPVVFVHPGYSDYRTWSNQMEAFSKDYRAIAYSRRYCFPNKTPIDSTSMFSMVHVNDLISFIESLDAGPVHLVGHSAGGWIALQAALHQPELVKTLILGEPAVTDFYSGDPLGDSLLGTFIQGLIRSNEAYRRNEDEKAVELFFGLVMGSDDYFENLSDKNRQIIMDNIPESKAAALVQNPKGEAPPPITCKNLQELAIPVLIVSGERSPKFVSYMQDRLEPCLQNKERVTLPNTSHGLHYESPGEFNKAVLGFINKYQ